MGGECSIKHRSIIDFSSQTAVTRRFPMTKAKKELRLAGSEMGRPAALVRFPVGFAFKITQDLSIFLVNDRDMDEGILRAAFWLSFERLRSCETIATSQPMARCLF